MEKESKEGRENGEENGTNHTKDGENTQTADKDVAEKRGVDCDTENGVDQHVADEIKTDACQGTEVLPGAGLDPHTEDASVDTSRKTDKEESGEPQITDFSSEPKETKPKTVLPGAGLDPHTEDAAVDTSRKTDKEESGEPQITDFSSELKETKPKTVPRSSTTNPTTPDRNSESKDPKDKEGARERKTKEKTEEEKRATENKANEQKDSKEDAAAIKECTKGDETTKQRDIEEKVEHVSKERPVSISVCTSAYEFNVKGLLSFLEDLMKDHPELIKEVKVHALPYNDLDNYKFPKDTPVDVMLLCHSINNRRFAITDVMDALYNEYLPYCARVVGKNKMGVIVHDFDDMRDIVQSSRMGSFCYKQPKAFETTSLQITCGHIEKKEQVLKQMQKVDREKLLEFLKNASKFPEEMNVDPSLLKVATQGISSAVKFLWESVTSGGRSQDGTSVGSSVDPSEDGGNDHDTIRNAKAHDDKTKRSANERQSPPQPSKRACTKNGTSGGSHQTPRASVDEGKLNPSREASLIGQQRPGTSNLAAAAHTHGSSPSPRRISISVCSSANEKNVKGFISKLTELQTRQPHMIADVRFWSLPYNDIDSFKFPSNDPVDVMVLCHSIKNRGFSITNVLGALYKKHLEYCRDLIGKKKLAVIVHDFSDCKPKSLDVKMELFRTKQPSTFEFVDTVIVCGSLEVPGKIEMRDEDDTLLTFFFEKARFEPKANNADKK